MIVMPYDRGEKKYRNPKKRLPIAAVSCEEAEFKDYCEVWWLATIEDRSYEAKAEIPFEDVKKVTGELSPRKAEIKLTNLLADSELEID